MKIVALLKSKKTIRTRVQKINDLGLPPGWEASITEIVQKHKMLWEPWLETAKNFQELRALLKKRGYKGLPINGSPLIFSAASNEIQGTHDTGIKKVMLQRKI